MPCCAVFGCSEKGIKNPDVHLHTFPSDIDLQKVWIQKCLRKELINPKTSRICSRHFTPDDYERNLKYELLRIAVPTSRIRLKKGSVPSLLLPERNYSQQKDCSPTSSRLALDHTYSRWPRTINEDDCIDGVSRHTQTINGDDTIDEGVSRHTQTIFEDDSIDEGISRHTQTICEGNGIKEEPFIEEVFIKQEVPEEENQEIEDFHIYDKYLDVQLKVEPVTWDGQPTHCFKEMEGDLKEQPAPSIKKLPSGDAKLNDNHNQSEINLETECQPLDYEQICGKYLHDGGLHNIADGSAKSVSHLCKIILNTEECHQSQNVDKFRKQLIHCQDPEIVAHINRITNLSREETSCADAAQKIASFLPQIEGRTRSSRHTVNTASLKLKRCQYPSKTKTSSDAVTSTSSAEEIYRDCKTSTTTSKEVYSDSKTTTTSKKVYRDSKTTTTSKEAYSDSKTTTTSKEAHSDSKTTTTSTEVYSDSLKTTTSKEAYSDSLKTTTSSLKEVFGNEILIQSKTKKVLQCKSCNYTTPLNSSLRRHTITKHSKVRPFLCPRCDYTAPLKYYMDRHISAVHNKGEKIPV